MTAMVLRQWPLVAAFVSAVVLVWLRDRLLPLVLADQISLDGLYSSVFGWSSIQTGFLFGVFGFIVGKRDGFVGAIAKTEAMKRFGGDLKWAISIGFLLTFTSMPLIVYPLAPHMDGQNYVIISAWFALFVWAFLLFCKVAYVFGIIIQTPDDQDKQAR